MVLPAPPHSVLIVGAGEFGATTALALAEGPYRSSASLITVLDRGAQPPAEDAASSDYNKIVRADYSDPLYQAYALDAIAQWRSPRWREHFHECGIVVGSHESHPQAGYVRKSYQLNVDADDASVEELREGERLREFYPEGVELGTFPGHVAYKNNIGGWAASRDAVVSALDLSRALGVQCVCGEASTLLHTADGTDVRGVRLRDGRTLEADIVILATGSWTPQLLPELAKNCLPTGQTVATIQLTEEERIRYKDIPVSLFLDTGFYCFPPNPDGVFKMAIHDRGWLSPTGSLPSLPRTCLTAGYEAQEIPSCALEAIQRGLRAVYPELVDKEIKETRLCWYSDRESGDFLFDWHPKYRSLFVAAGGSGHAYKFLPLLGSWILSSLQRSLPAHLAALWSFHGDKSRLDKSRGEGPIVRRDLDSGAVVEVRVPERDLEKIRAKL
ncbi:hypothetical protein Rhopal_007406-T1 [Rhodotorula paludigena]|uniref:FAD dependent oxidoreductase domain-containing protein n=1 Tax=Rhodotorula paludigena TaxID=86838 RepID=A0AAV5GYA0_9BASI|nr:hypothetical protein Rhopal_007406-T1 [Rhodotorula paludigena]